MMHSAVIVGIVGMMTFACASPGVETRRMRSVLERLDLDRPELAPVSEAARTASVEEAVDTLLTYYRERDMAYHFDVEAPLRNLDAIDEAIHDTSHPDDILTHRFTFEKETVEFEDGIDWRHTIYDPEWGFMFHRHTHFQTLVEKWRQTGDTRYVEEFVHQLHEWDRQVPADFPRRLENGLRLTNWIRLFPVAVQAEAFDGAALVVFLDNIHAMAEALNRRGFDGYSGGNWGAMEAQGTLQAGAYFPEFSDAATWFNDATERMVHQFLTATHPDGVYRGQSPSYHNVMLRQLTQFWHIVQAHEVDLPDEFTERVDHILDFAAAYTRPDLSIPQFGDSDSAHMGSRLRELAGMFDRPDLLYLASGGTEGERPEWQNRLFSEGGFASLRSPWDDGRDQRWLMFDFGPYGRGGYRLMSLDCYAYGQPLIVMPGRYRYHTEDDARALFMSTPFQNTLSIDGANQTVNPPRGLIHADLEGADKQIHAWHAGYRHLAGRNAPEDAIIHDRQITMVDDRYWIVTDRVTVRDTTPRTYAQNWHFLPTTLWPLDQFDGVTTTFPEGNIALIPLRGDPEMREQSGWYSPEYGVRHEAPWLVFEAERDDGWIISTLLLPYRGDTLLLEDLSTKVDEATLTLELTWSDGEQETVHVTLKPLTGP